MKEKINIAEILKDKPVNTKLYSPLFSEVYFSHVSGGYIAVEHHGSTSLFLSSGRFYDYDGAEPLLFPSREMRDWNKFNWKKGDVLVSNDGKERVIFVKFQDNRYMRFFGKFFSQRKEDGDIDYKSNLDASVNDYTLENMDAAQTYIKAVEERCGGKLNKETLEVEKSEFKDWDFITIKLHRGRSLICVFKAENDENYYLHASLDSRGMITINEDSYCSKSGCIVRLSTEEEKTAFFDALAKKGKAWDAEKKQIVDLKPKVDVLKPFDRVLVRNCKSENWRANLFGYIDKDGFYCCVWANWAYCIPYIGNESLLGTTKDVEG